MAIKELKDYYRILEIKPVAKAEDIKTAYRRLAKQYHPDANSSTYTSLHFLEIKEAYDVLSHEQKRKRYDEERWLMGMSSRAKDQVVITPEWILTECKRLSLHMETVDIYRMSHSALRDYVFLLLSAPHMAILQQTPKYEVHDHIVLELLKATKALKHMYMQEVGIRLAELAGNNNELLQRVHAQVTAKYREAKQEKYLPLIIVFITIALCLLGYIWAKR